MRRTELMRLALVITMGMPLVAHGKPCTGAGRLQLRWSQKAATAVVLFSATLCDTPPVCTAAGSRESGTMSTQAPITFTLRDSSGKTLTGVIDPADPACAGRCGQVNRGGCPRGADSYRLAGSALRYAFAGPGQTTVTLSKLRIPTTDRPELSAPVTVTVTDANGYSIEKEMTKCRVRSSATGVAISCS